MNIMSGILVYVSIWIVVLFIVLPLGVTVSKHHEPGFATSAPERPYLGVKFFLTSLLALVLWALYYYVITYTDLIKTESFFDSLV